MLHSHLRDERARVRLFESEIILRFERLAALQLLLRVVLSRCCACACVVVALLAVSQPSLVQQIVAQKSVGLCVLVGRGRREHGGQQLR